MTVKMSLLHALYFQNCWGGGFLEGGVYMLKTVQTAKLSIRTLYFFFLSRSLDSSFRIYSKHNHSINQSAFISFIIILMKIFPNLIDNQKKDSRTTKSHDSLKNMGKAIFYVEIWQIIFALVVNLKYQRVLHWVVI